jgi:hypothetical protein
MGLRSDAGLLAEEYNPKTNGLMGSFPQPFSPVALETMAVDISRQRGLPSGDRDRALHTSLFRLSSSDGSGLYLERDKTMSINSDIEPATMAWLPYNVAGKAPAKEIARNSVES